MNFRLLAALLAASEATFDLENVRNIDVYKNEKIISAKKF
jgi:hypothetical protein